MSVFFRVLLVVFLGLPVWTGQAWADTPVVKTDAGVNAWLKRLHEASRHRAYTGTFVVSAGGNLVSAKIWHVCDGAQQMERIEPLTGVPRSIFRRDDQVMTFYPQTKVAVTQQRESLGSFPHLLQSGDADLSQTYQLKVLGSSRIAGFDADVAYLQPKDLQRYGYRIWSEKKSGLVMQLQTVDSQGRVLEQAAFSDLQLDAPVSMGQLSQMMEQTQGYRVERPDVQKTTPEAQGWRMQNTVAGFQSVGCYQRNLARSSVQWMFSDGLATVSLFIENFDSHRHVHEGMSDMGGATHILTRRFSDWWLTVVGEVPPGTLNAFAQGLERRK